MFENRENIGLNKYATGTGENKHELMQIQGTITCPNLNATFSPFFEENKRHFFFFSNETDLGPKGYSVAFKTHLHFTVKYFCHRKECKNSPIM